MNHGEPVAKLERPCSRAWLGVGLGLGLGLGLGIRVRTRVRVRVRVRVRAVWRRLADYRVEWGLG